MHFHKDMDKFEVEQEDCCNPVVDCCTWLDIGTAKGLFSACIAAWSPGQKNYLYLSLPEREYSLFSALFCKIFCNHPTNRVVQGSKLGANLGPNLASNLAKLPGQVGHSTMNHTLGIFTTSCTTCTFLE